MISGQSLVNEYPQVAGAQFFVVVVDGCRCAMLDAANGWSCELSVMSQSICEFIEDKHFFQC